MLFGTWSHAHAYDSSYYIKTRLKTWSLYSCKGRRTCLRQCLKEDFIARINIYDHYHITKSPHGDQTTAGQLEKHILKPMLGIFTTYMETRLKSGQLFLAIKL